MLGLRIVRLLLKADARPGFYIGGGGTEAVRMHFSQISWSFVVVALSVVQLPRIFGIIEALCPNKASFLP